MRQRFEFTGMTEMGGKIYEKGKSQLVFYHSGLIKYWPDFKGDYSNLFYRDKKGRKDEHGFYFPEAKKYLSK